MDDTAVLPDSASTVADSMSTNWSEQRNDESVSVEMDSSMCTQHDSVPEKMIESFIENKEDKENARSNRIKRRMDLALAALPAPKKLSADSTVIDLTTDQDVEQSMAWLKNKFPTASKARPAKITAPRHGTMTFKDRLAVKDKLAESLRKKRKEGLELRKHMYAEDNEGLMVEEEEEEEERREKRKKKAKKSVEYDSDDDEDWKEGQEEGDGEEDEEESELGEEDDDKQDDVKDSASDVVEETPSSMMGGDETQKTVLGNDDDDDDDFALEMSDSAPPPPVPALPASLSQWFGSSNDIDKAGSPSSLKTPSGEAGVGDDLLMLCSGKFETQQNSAGDELLMLCSGKFETQGAAATQSVGNELLMLCSGQFESQPAEEAEKPEEITQARIDSDDEDSMPVGVERSAKKSKKKMVMSDDEEETEEGEKKEEEPAENKEETPDMEMEEGDGETETVETAKTPKKRAVLDDSDEEEEEGDGEADDEAEDEEEEQEETGEDDEQKGAETADGDEKGYDSDDEMAVIRKLKKQSEMFDDEASLSGDDVGSDGEEEEGADYYEREEGDDDEEIPDNETLRVNLHQQMLRQQMNEEHKQLVRLQDKLLTDGDLGGVETNRSFRTKLRADAEEALAGEEGKEKEEQDEEDESEETEAVAARRAEALKWKMEQEREREEKGGQAEQKPADAWDMALEGAVVEEEGKRERGRQSLIGQGSLAYAVKDTSTSSINKGMYKMGTDGAGAGLKRIAEEDCGLPVKKARLSTLKQLD